MKLIVLGGGDSPEREVSLRSAAAVAKAAKEAGFEVEEHDPADKLDFLDDSGKDVIVFPILHGEGGEDGTIQAELEKRGLSFLGSDSKSSHNCFDKWRTRQILTKAGIPMAEADLVGRETYEDHILAKEPHVLKILHGGSSIGTLVVRDPTRRDPRKVEEIFAMEENAVLEKLVDGVEITVPILDKSALPPIEVHPPTDGEFDYANKYNGKSQELCPPPSLDGEQIKRAQALAEKVHAAMGCRHLSRTDTIMRKDGSFVVLEINTMPGLTDQSLFPKSAKEAGISMPELVKRFVQIIQNDI